MGKIDGVVEVAWRSTKDVHGTAQGEMGTGSHRHAFTAQVNKSLDEAVQHAWRDRVHRVNDDRECFKNDR